MSADALADEPGLRVARRERAFDQLDAHGIDVLLLGREANARYVSGARRLWTAGTRPFGPGCVVVRSTREIHLVSTWEEGVPDDIPHEHLFGITWNPGNLLAWLGGIDGVADAKRVGTDALTPRFARLLPKVFPDAELVDAQPALDAARRIKTTGEIAAIKEAIAVAEAALAASVAEVRPGVTERRLAAVFMDTMAAHGVTTPATQRVARFSTRPERRGASAPAHPGDLVTFDAGVVAGGYVAEVARTWPVGPDAADRAGPRFGRADDLWDRLLGACRPGATGHDLLAAYDDAGEALPPIPIATGLGLGFDVPVITRDLPSTAAGERLDPGMVLAVTAQVGDGPGAVVRKDVVLITADDPEVLTSSPHWVP